MAQPDVEAQENLFTEQDVTADLKKFTSSEWLYLNDLNNLNYTSGQIKFDTLVNKDQWVIWSDSYLAVPISISSLTAGHALVEGDPIAWKTSVLSLINSVQITTASGQSLVNDTMRVNYINNLRLLIESAWDAQVTNLTELQCWKEVSGNNFTSTTAISPLTNSVMAGADNQPYTYTGTPVVQQANRGYNEGFALRAALAFARFLNRCACKLP